MIISASDSKSLIESNQYDLWQSTLKNMGPKYAVLSNFPEDPSLN